MALLNLFIKAFTFFLRMFFMLTFDFVLALYHMGGPAVVISVGVRFFHNRMRPNFLDDLVKIPGFIFDFVNYLVLVEKLVGLGPPDAQVDFLHFIMDER